MKRRRPRRVDPVHQAIRKEAGQVWEHYERTGQMLDGRGSPALSLLFETARFRMVHGKWRSRPKTVYFRGRQYPVEITNAARLIVSEAEEIGRRRTLVMGPLFGDANE